MKFLSKSILLFSKKLFFYQKYFLVSGFKDKAKGLVEQFILRLSTTTDDDSSAIVQHEFNVALDSLRATAVERLEDLFAARSCDVKFSETSKDDVRLKLPNPLDFAFKNCAYTWKLRCKRRNDELELARLWTHFTDILNQHLKKNNTMSQDEAETQFSTQWMIYEQKFNTRMQNLKRHSETIKQEVVTRFNDLQSRHAHESEFAVLKPVGSTSLVLDNSLLQIPEMVWEMKYFVQSGTFWPGSEDAAKEYMYNELIPTMRTSIKTVMEQVKNDIRFYKWDNVADSQIINWMQDLSKLVNEYEAMINQDRKVTLRRAQFMNALHLSLLLIVYETIGELDEQESHAQSNRLHEHKNDLRNHFLLHVQKNVSDRETARDLATNFFNRIKEWIDNEVVGFASGVREKVLQDLPDASHAHERAFAQSFAGRDWMNVLEYCLDVNAFLEKIFLQLFFDRQTCVLEQQKPYLEKRIVGVFTELAEIAANWAKSREGDDEILDQIEVHSDPGADQDINSREGISVEEFKGFIWHFYKSTEDKQKQGLRETLATCFPQTADFHIQNATTWGDYFKDKIHVLNAEDSADAELSLGLQLNTQLEKQSHKVEEKFDEQKIDVKMIEKTIF